MSSTSDAALDHRTDGVGSLSAEDVPRELAVDHRAITSTQDHFGRILTKLTRGAPEVAEHVVTAAPDVSVSTNLAGWINKVGVWSQDEEAVRKLRWPPKVDRGPHRPAPGARHLGVEPLLAPEPARGVS